MEQDCASTQGENNKRVALEPCSRYWCQFLAGRQPSSQTAGLQILATSGECSVHARHSTIESLKQAYAAAVSNFPMEVVRAAINNWPSRLHTD